MASSRSVNAPTSPPFVVPAKVSEWELQRLQIRKQLVTLLGRLPPKPRIPEVKTLSREQCPGFVREKFEFDNGAGAKVPGYLLLPEEKRKPAPAILFCHWHGGEYEIGKEELFQARHSPIAPGPELARLGFAVIGIDAYGFGERIRQGPGGPTEWGASEELSASKFNLWLGRTLWGMILRDDRIALDYLLSRPEVDPQRVGVTGISMGATRSWWLMALEERLKTGVAVACLTRYRNLIQHQGLKEHGIYYFVPGMLRYFDTEAVVALSAPRPMLFMTGDQDPGSPVDGIREVEAAVRPVYRLYGEEELFQNVIYPGLGHVYTQQMWANTVQWMKGRLQEG